MHTELSLMLIRFTPQYKGRLDLSSKEKKKNNSIQQCKTYGEKLEIIPASKQA